MAQFNMHQELPHVVCLHVHLEGEHLVTWREDGVTPLQEIIETGANGDSTLTAYFKANQQYPAAHELLYQDMPTKFVWNAKKRVWTPRKRDFAIV